MAQINFYALSDSRYENTEDRLTVVCSIADKAYGLGHKVYILADSEAQCRQLDKLLWEFKASSFLPHQIGNSFSETRICISEQEPSQEFTDVVINLSTTSLTSPQRLTRLNELVGPDNVSLQAGREHFRTYKAQGLEIETHKI